MADNYLITGYWGEPHVTAENDRGINAATFGVGRFVLPVGNRFRAEYIGNNTIRVYDGKLIDNGAVAGIPAGQYVDLLIPEAGQGLKRNDLIVFQYQKDASTLIESGVFTVVNGVEAEGTATDPELTQEDILSDTATFDQMALWRVPVAGSVISAPVQVFKMARNTQGSGGAPVVTATSTDGVTYEATVADVTELYVGLEVKIIPNRTSASRTAKLNLNGLGEKAIRQRVSSNTGIAVVPENVEWMHTGQPITLMYNGTYWIADLPRANAIDLYGIVPVELGGTGLARINVDSFLVGDWDKPMVAKTPTEVVEMLNNTSVQNMTAVTKIPSKGLYYINARDDLALSCGGLIYWDGVSKAIFAEHTTMGVVGTTFEEQPVTVSVIFFVAANGNLKAEQFNHSDQTTTDVTGQYTFAYTKI